MGHVNLRDTIQGNIPLGNTLLGNAKPGKYPDGIQYVGRHPTRRCFAHQ